MKTLWARLSIRSSSARGAREWRGRAVTLCLCSACLIGGATATYAQEIDSNLWGVDNTVTALARSGNTLYVGGAFRRAGPSTGGAVAVPKHCGRSKKPFPKVTGYVYSIAADGKDGWFLSGNFTAVGGVPRYCLAHVLADGSVAPWNPNPNYVPYGTGGVLVAGNTVYVGGGFATIAGKPRLYIAALDATTGDALDWDAHCNGLVAPLALRGNTLYVGGLFSRIGGQARNNIAALDAITGQATAWNPDAGGGVGSSAGDGGVWSVLVRGNRVFVGGSFSRIGGKNRTMLAELDAATGLATDWDPGVQGPGSPYPFVEGLLTHDEKLYVGGSFSSIGGQNRRGLAAIDLPTREITDWDPNANSGGGIPEIRVMRRDARSIYVGGYFQSIGGQPRNNMAEVDARTGKASEWNPDPSNEVFALAIDDEAVYLGGWFKSMGMVWRHNLAAFDLTTGEVTAWNPNPDGAIVYALAASGGRIYAAGHFTEVGGQPRSAIAALDTVTGAPLDWSPDADQIVKALAVRDGVVYAGGLFTTIGGQPRRYLAALDANTGRATAWNPAPNDWVEALSVRDTTVYVGGWFEKMGGVPRLSAAAVGATSGALLPWHADTDGLVKAIARGANAVYLGGLFYHVNGQPRNYLAALDAGTSEVLPWDPEPSGPREDYYDPSIHALAVSGNIVLVGGDFTVIGGQPRASLAALDGETGALLDWNPNPDQSVWALAVGDHTLYAGGYLQAAQNMPHAGLIAVSMPAGRTVTRRPLAPLLSVAVAPVTPNPARSDSKVRYALPAKTPVSFAVYDLQGRLMEAVLNHQEQEAGDHELTVRTESLPNGCYLYRLEAGGIIRTQKVVVLK